MTINEYLVNHPYEEANEAEAVDIVAKNEFVEYIGGIGGTWDFAELLDLANNANGYVCLVEEGQNTELDYLDKFETVVVVGYEDNGYYLEIFVKEA